MHLHRSLGVSGRRRAPPASIAAAVSPIMAALIAAALSPVAAASIATATGVPALRRELALLQSLRRPRASITTTTTTPITADSADIIRIRPATDALLG